MGDIGIGIWVLNDVKGAQQNTLQTESQVTETPMT